MRDTRRRQGATGLNSATAPPASRMGSKNSAPASDDPTESQSTLTATPRAAARTSASRTATPQESGLTMYISRSMRLWAASIAASIQRHWSRPSGRNTARLPSMKRGASGETLKNEPSRASRACERNRSSNRRRHSGVPRSGPTVDPEVDLEPSSAMAGR
jgi:hypothetical protein